MPAVGGSITTLDLDGRGFAVTADADAQMKLGGKNNSVESNGDASSRLLQTQTPWSITGLSVSIDDDAGDLEFLQALQNRKSYYPITVTLAGGQVWQGTGQITGDNSRATQSASMPIEVMGEGELTQQ